MPYTDIQECMMYEEVMHAMQDNDHICTLSTYMMQGWLSPRTKVMKKFNHTGPLEIK